MTSRRRTGCDSEVIDVEGITEETVRIRRSSVSRSEVSWSDWTTGRSCVTGKFCLVAWRRVEATGIKMEIKIRFRIKIRAEDWKSDVEVSIMIEEHVVKEEQEVKSTDVEDADNGRYARLSWKRAGHMD